ncbi:L-serine ammonia-lyase, iron-sulfur-dependent, subunit alpha [Alteribacillus bidgolensis]|uniref:L-serine dehydratase n=1 Tax=Alteribacillus bidgolensis TaxID=930129 RepID=A0A1G8HA40_9BACI|nr:L-serine ammonia-lyase, iron-sulfur-dependent, subunit alpha [Alteribacillus bidgolensis]SDI03360.1 L-serine ammonia-lyase [Alteribacillus bidgolensis]
MKIESMKELIQQCEEEGKTISEVMLDMEVENSGKTHEALIDKMTARLQQMKDTIDLGIQDPSSSPSGISGGDALRVNEYVKKESILSGNYIGDAMSFSIATSESNAKMGIIVATPTAGAAGVLPGVLFSLHKNDNTPFEKLVEGLFTASALGYVIANRSFISGAAGGCQAEVGSATAMAAGAIVELKGGSPEQAVHAAAIALKSLLGLVCDPVAGLVEVPCIKRNVMGTAIAFSAADLSLAGVKSRIPCDEVIKAMYDIGSEMPRTLKETALGGLAATETGQQVKERMFKKKGGFE